jgi:lipopolysaccharide/colanic/teichoic acid biosynthesis glycosyltransferase
MLKRLFDIFLSIFLLIILSPFIAITAIFVIIDLGFPIFFTQIRPGYKGIPFKIYKFRSMKGVDGKDRMVVPDAKRLTKFGLFLRSTSIDEVPSLWNVLVGDMSLVGPRPLLTEYLPLYSKKQARRHDVKPGITGWAQINGRNKITWRQKFKLDIWYIDNQSFLLDLRILALTVKKVFLRSDISANNQATVELFTGSN